VREKKKLQEKKDAEREKRRKIRQTSYRFCRGKEKKTLGSMSMKIAQPLLSRRKGGGKKGRKKGHDPQALEKESENNRGEVCEAWAKVEANGERKKT